LTTEDGGDATTEATTEDGVLDALPDAVLVVDARTIVRANGAATAALGDGGPLVGAPVAKVLAPGEWDRLELLDAQRARGWAVPSMCRLRFRRADGTPLTTDVRFRRLGGTKIVLVARDAAPMTRAETLVGVLGSLPSAMEGAEALLDTSESILVGLGWTLAFTEILEGASKTLRIIAPSDDPVGDYGRTLVGREIPFDATPVIAEVVRTARPLYLDNLPTAQSSSVRAAVALSSSMDRAGVGRSAWCPIVVDDRVSHVVAVTGPDITEHDFVAIQLFAARLGAADRLHALRREMVHRERLAAVGEMAAVLAHEVRNPLGVMFTALGTLSREGPGRHPEAQALLDIMQDEANRLQRLVSDLLEFSSASTPVLDATAVAAVAQDAVQAARHDHAFQAGHPSVTVDVDEALLVRTDRVLLRRILLNIVVNAFQHVTRGGKVEVRGEATTSHVTITVSNDGPVIPAALARKVFEPFFTTQATGTGLGLAIVRRLCTEVGAAIELVPRDGGAAFRVTLPRTR
jgi:signal transduction histidine kinase